MSSDAEFRRISFLTALRRRLEVLTANDTLCDPYALPGYLKFSEDLRETKWVPLDQSCPATDWLRGLANGTLPESFPRNTTILVMGDSVDRNSVEQLAWRTGVKYHRAAYHNITQERPEGWDERGVPWVVKVPTFNLTFANGFFYGLVSRRIVSPFCVSITYSCACRTTPTTSRPRTIGTNQD